MTTAIKSTAVGCSVAAVLAMVATFHPNELRTSQAGLELLAGYEDCRLAAYKDHVGVPTIGVGSTKGVCMGQVIDVAKAAEMFVRDVREAEQCVITHFNGKAMPQSVFDSTTSLVYNNGCYGTRWNKKANRPTWIQRYAVAEDWSNVCARHMDFVNAGGQRSQGLVNRRTKEIQHCVSYRISGSGL